MAWTLRLATLLVFLLGLASAGPARAQGYAAGEDAFDAGDYRTALEIWKPLADDGDRRAQYALGVLYERGPGDFESDMRQAAHWYARAASQGHPAAQNNLGLMYAQGRGVGRDPKRAARLWQQAAQAGHLMGQYNLGLAYYRGEGLEQDNEAARRNQLSAARSGLADAQFALAQMYRLGVVVEEDPAIALAWYRRAAAQGHADAKSQAEALAEKGVEPASLDRTGQGTGGGEAKQAAQTRAAGPARDAAEPPPPGAKPERTARREAAETDTPEPAASRAGDGGAWVWLGSLRARAKAEQHWQDMQARFPAALKGLQPRYARVDLGDDGTFVRVLAGPFAGTDAAGEVCARLRAGEPPAFCKVQTRP